MPKLARDKLAQTKLKLQDLSFARLIPNMATTIALCTGLSAIRFAMNGQVQLAMVAIVMAAFFDAMDGRLARLLGASSDFGAELDSLSDFVSFGVAPAVVMYILSLHVWSGWGWAVSTFFAVCCALRLARFNTTLKTSDAGVEPSWTKQFFTGAPAPAGAIVGLFPVLLTLSSDRTIFLNPILTSVFLLLAGLLFISRIPTFSLKSHQIPRGFVGPILLVVGLFVAAILTEPWVTLSGCVLLYVLSIPFSVRSYNRLLRAHHQKNDDKGSKGRLPSADKGDKS